MPAVLIAAHIRARITISKEEMLKNIPFEIEQLAQKCSARVAKHKYLVANQISGKTKK